MPRKKTQVAEPVRVLLRHADAGLKSEWPGPDDWRGLTELGHDQARAVVGMLGDLPIQRILSSPSLRCRQTVVPLARARELDVEPLWQLGRNTEPVDVLALLADPDTAAAVVCTHRETLQAVFSLLSWSGDAVARAGDPMEKAAAWILRGTVGSERPARLEYLGSGAALPV
jgi:phosphohistidine phosphatase SixA